MKNFKLIGYGYIALVFLLFLYSFTQVDLSLTLSRVSIWQIVQRSFQHIGYFQRPLSTTLYLFIISLLYLYYLLYLLLAKRGMIEKRRFWVLVILTSVILLFSYNAFSYDLFNYIFDAKIVTYYQQNPYQHPALDYPGDPMLSFMHWTHRTYPYGPFWLVLTLPLSYLGFGFFLPTLYLFKALSVLSFLLSAYFIGKIAEKTKIIDPLFAVTFFALNPLVIIESLVSAHNDIVMMALALASLYFLITQKKVKSTILLFLSIGVKFATATLLPIFVMFGINKIKVRGLVYTSLFLMVGTILLATARTNFQPWYLLYALPFAALLSDRYYIIIPSIVVSLFSLLQYVPFLYLGNWNPPVPTILNLIMITSVIVSGILVVGWRLKQKY